MTKPTTGAVKSWLSVASGYVRSDEEDEHLRQEAIRRVELHDRLVAALRDIVKGAEPLRFDTGGTSSVTDTVDDYLIDEARALLAEIGGGDD